MSDRFLGLFPLLPCAKGFLYLILSLSGMKSFRISSCFSQGYRLGGPASVKGSL